MSRAYIAVSLTAACVALCCGCGSGGSATPSKGGGALSGEATSAATGDIPDTQVFLVFHNAAAGYSIRYPEGWAQQGGGRDVTLRDKNNIVHISLRNGPSPTAAGVSAELSRLALTTPTLRAGRPAPYLVPAGRAIKVSYTTESAPNPVTGKRVTLIVDRYELGHLGRVVTIDLGTAKGVDNVDAYRMMAQSFRWS